MKRKISILLCMAFILCSFATANAFGDSGEFAQSNDQIGVEMFNQYIALLDSETAQAILSDDELVYCLQRYEYWFPEDSVQTPMAVNLPLSAYPSGSYFSVNGSSCSCHSDCTYTNLANSCNISGTNTAGNCKKYNGGIQCMGFAYYVYRQYNGVECSSSNKLDRTFSISDSADAEDYFLHIPLGSHVRVNNRHSIIIAARSATGVTIYEGNSDGQCKVNYTTKTWAKLAQDYPSITYAWTQSHFHSMSSKTPWVKNPSPMTCLERTGSCIFCGVSTTQYDSYHDMVLGKCTKCGYLY